MLSTLGASSNHISTARIWQPHPPTTRETLSQSPLPIFSSHLQTRLGAKPALSRKPHYVNKFFHTHLVYLRYDQCQHGTKFWVDSICLLCSFSKREELIHTKKIYFIEIVEKCYEKDKKSAERFCKRHITWC